jgi:small subunit ribosomal protein S1
VYGRVTKLVPFGAFVQVGDGIEGLVHISEMSAHHVELPEQVVTPGEELWVKIIDLDLQRRRISLSIKQAAEGGIVADEYKEHFGEHAFDDEGNYIGVEGEEPAIDPETGAPIVPEAVPGDAVAPDAVVQEVEAAEGAEVLAEAVEEIAAEDAAPEPAPEVATLGEEPAAEADAPAPDAPEAPEG